MNLIDVTKALMTPAYQLHSVTDMLVCFTHKNCIISQKYMTIFRLWLRPPPLVQYKSL